MYVVFRGYIINKVFFKIDIVWFDFEKKCKYIVYSKNNCIDCVIWFIILFNDLMLYVMIWGGGFFDFILVLIFFFIWIKVGVSMFSLVLILVIFSRYNMIFFLFFCSIRLFVLNDKMFGMFKFLV